MAIEDGALGVLRAAADPRGVIALGIAGLAGRFGVSRQHVGRIIRRLAEAGAIEIVPNMGPRRRAVWLRLRRGDPPDRLPLNLREEDRSMERDVRLEGSNRTLDSDDPGPAGGSINLPQELPREVAAPRGLPASGVDGVLPSRAVQVLGERYLSGGSNILKYSGLLALSEVAESFFQGSESKLSRIKNQTLRASAGEASRALVAAGVDRDAATGLVPLVEAELRAALAARRAGRPRTLVLGAIPAPAAPGPKFNPRKLPVVIPAGAEGEDFGLRPGERFTATEVAAKAADYRARRFLPVTPLPEAPVEAMVEVWNEVARSAGLAGCRVLNDERRKELRARWKSPIGGNLALWRAVCETAAASEWCQTNRATIDHLLFRRTCTRYVDRVMSETDAAPAELVDRLNAIQADAWRSTVRRLALVQFEAEHGGPPVDLDDLAAVDALTARLLVELPDPDRPCGAAAASRLLRRAKAEPELDRRRD